MKKSLLLLASALMLASCDNSLKYEIDGTVTDPALNGEYVYLYPYGVQKAKAIDSALIENGRFKFLNKFEGKRMYATCLVKRQSEKMAPYGQTAAFVAWFVFEPGSMKATLDTVNSRVEGTEENDAHAALMTAVSEARKDFQSLVKDIRSGDSEKAKAAYEKLNEINQKVDGLLKEYLNNHPNTISAGKIFTDLKYSLSEEEQEKIIAAADSVFMSVPGVDRIAAHLEVMKKVAVGKKFTDFEMPDVEGKQRKLSEYVGNGKVVLIDFWASWCSPCRASMPALVKTYNKYKAKGFDIVGVSLDNKEENWKKAIEDMNLKWNHLSDLKFWQSEGAALYGVNSIPHTVLIDKTGVIAARNLHGEELEKKIEELLAK